MVLKAITILTEYELEGGKSEKLAAAFQEAREHLSHGVAGRGFMGAFDAFAKEYARTLREYIALKQERQDRRLAAEEEKQSQSDIVEQRTQEERRKMNSVADAQAASKRAEDETRATAVREAMAEQARIREQKLQEVLASPAYKIWQASLQIEEGQRMVETGQRVLGHDDAVQRESGVVDLSARRAAGEQIVAGKRLVERAFATYKQIGGTAPTPDDVRAGPDPAQKYR